jgi:holo-[acyl-carrier protein] synthase
MKVPLVRVGVDMVSLPALAAMIETSGAGFIDACWSSEEQDYCNGSLERLAARWAAKEATMKALGHGIGEIDPVDIEVVAVEGEAPKLLLQGSALIYAQRAGLERFVVSLCHEGELAIAYVLAHNTRALDSRGGMRALQLYKSGEVLGEDGRHGCGHG